MSLLSDIRKKAEKIARNLAGKTGSAIDTLGSKFNSNQSTSNKAGSTDWSATLQNIGGNKVGSGFGLVKVAHAAKPIVNKSTTTVKRNMSADGGIYDANGNFTPYFVGTTVPDTTKKQIVTGDGKNDKDKEPTIDKNGNLVDAATAEYNRKRSAILSRLATIKEEARRLRGQAKGTWDFTTGEVKKNYDALKKLSGEKLQQALRGLAAEDTDVQNMYGRVAGNARRAMESALMRNRMLHRAMGSLGSSFYLNAQGDTRNQGMNTINDTAVEEAAKRGLIGTAKSKTNTDFAQNDLAIGSEEAKLNQDALTEYNNSVANADLLEKNYNIDSTEAIDEADTKLTSSLEAIKKYLSDKSIANKARTVNTGTLGNFVKSYDAISPIKSTLNTRPNYDNTNQFTANISKMGIPNSGFRGLIASANNSFDQYNPNSPNYFLKFKKKPQEDLNQYYMNLA